MTVTTGTETTADHARDAAAVVDALRTHARFLVTTPEHPDGDGGVELADLDLSFGGQPMTADEAPPLDADEAEEIPEVDSPLDE